VTDQPPGPGPWSGPPAAAGARPAPPPDRRHRLRRGLAFGGAIALIAVCAITVLGFIGWNIGLEALAVGLAAAVVPVPVLVLVFLWLDRYEPEPVRYLIVCFGWGAFGATGLALAVNTGASELVGLPDPLVAVLVAPVIEEIGKLVVPLWLLLFRRRILSGITDGIVYCGLSATGFAMVENILYLGGVGYRAGLDEFGPATGVLMLIVIFLSRVFMSGFAHPLFTAASGVGIGIAARTSSVAVRWLAPVGGLLVAIGLHASWNLMAVLSSQTGQPLFFLYGYVAVMMPIFLGMVGLAIWLRTREGQITQRMLPDYVHAGWLSPPEVAALASLASRYSARRWARRVAGEPGARAMRGFQFAATRLALLRDGVRRGLDSSPAELARVAAEEQALLGEISALRRMYVGRDPAVPPARWNGRQYEIRFPDGSNRTVPPPPEPVLPLPVPLAPPAPPAPGYLTPWQQWPGPPPAWPPRR